MIVVSDTSPISNLVIIGDLGLLKLLYNKVVIPPAVYQELLKLESFGIEVINLLTVEWIEICPIADYGLVERLQLELDTGEAEAIALAIELNADRLLIDERLGRSVAERYGIKITGLLGGVLVAAKMTGVIPSVKPLLDSLIEQAGFRVSQDLYSRTLRDVNE